MTGSCPCDKHKTYAQCCAVIHQNPANATTPEQLMRARYSAYALGLIDFIIATYHPSAQAELQREMVLDAMNCQWLNLTIHHSCISDDEHEGWVEFRADYLTQGKQGYLHEHSRFLRETHAGQTCWYYIDATYPENNAVERKINRNDPCPCLSGKKYKKCCAS